MQFVALHGEYLINNRFVDTSGIYMLFIGWEVRAEIYFVEVFETETKYFSSTDRPKR